MTGGGRKEAEEQGGDRPGSAFPNEQKLLKGATVVACRKLLDFSFS